MQSISAAGGVLYRIEDERDNPEVLLIFRRGVWDLPKGKLEKGESIEECAVREVQEEVGCRLPEIRQELGTTFHEYDEGGVHFGKTTYWFGMQTKTQNEFEPQAAEDIEKVKWLPLEEAVDKVGYQSLKKVLNTFKSKIRGKN